MKIRSITYFDKVDWPLNKPQLQQAGQFIKIAQDTLDEIGFHVQTTRLASAPFPMILRDKVSRETVNFAVALEQQLLKSGFDYVSIGPALPSNLKSYQVIPDVLANTQNVFAAGIISSVDGGISLAAIRQCANVIRKNSVISGDGFGNLRFAALANVPPGTPFLPAAFHGSDLGPGFAIATEAADLAVSAFSNAANLEEARLGLINSIERVAGEITKVGQDLAAENDVQFKGIDFSLAPFPTREQSIGAAIEALGVPGVGYHGTLAGVALLTEAVERANFPRVGFNGVMLPVLEDTVLAESAAANVLTINDLLLYSAVCGTGLDTIPLPGSISEDQLFGVLLDLAVLAQRLGKPLTARLMPIPGKQAADATNFDFEYFANSSIMNLKAKPLLGCLAEADTFHLQTRRDNESR
jgi:uncharacterized protein (UPF0210 family)